MDYDPADLFASTATDALFKSAAYRLTQVGAVALLRENHTDIRCGITRQTPSPLPAELIQHHVSLFAQCNPRLARKLSEMTSASGEPLLLHDHVMLADGAAIRFVNLWNDATNAYDCFEEILSVRDTKSGFQAAAFYDHTHHRLTFDVGTADAATVSDLFASGMQALRGQHDHPYARALPFTERAMAVFKDRHADLLDDAVIDIAGHSAQADGLAQASYHLEKAHGKKPRSYLLINAVSPHPAVTARMQSDPAAVAQTWQSYTL